MRQSIGEPGLPDCAVGNSCCSGDRLLAVAVAREIVQSCDMVHRSAGGRTVHLSAYNQASMLRLRRASRRHKRYRSGSVFVPQNRAGSGSGTAGWSSVLQREDRSDEYTLKRQSAIGLVRGQS